MSEALQAALDVPRLAKHLAALDEAVSALQFSLDPLPAEPQRTDDADAACDDLNDLVCRSRPALWTEVEPLLKRIYLVDGEEATSIVPHVSCDDFGLPLALKALRKTQVAPGDATRTMQFMVRLLKEAADTKRTVPAIVHGGRPVAATPAEAGPLQSFAEDRASHLAEQVRPAEAASPALEAIPAAVEGEREAGAIEDRPEDAKPRGLDRQPSPAVEVAPRTPSLTPQPALPALPAQASPANPVARLPVDSGDRAPAHLLERQLSAGPAQLPAQRPAPPGPLVVPPAQEHPPPARTLASPDPQLPEASSPRQPAPPPRRDDSPPPQPPHPHPPPDFHPLLRETWFDASLTLLPPTNLPLSHDGLHVWQVPFDRQVPIEPRPAVRPFRHNDIGGNPQSAFSANEGLLFYSGERHELPRSIGEMFVVGEGGGDRGPDRYLDRIKEVGDCSVFHSHNKGDWRYGGEVREHSRISLRPRDFRHMPQERLRLWRRYFNREGAREEFDLKGVAKDGKQAVKYIQTKRRRPLVFAVFKVVGYNRVRINDWLARYQLSVGWKQAAKEKPKKGKKKKAEAKGEALDEAEGRVEDEDEEEWEKQEEDGEDGEQGEENADEDGALPPGGFAQAEGKKRARAEREGELADAVSDQDEDFAPLEVIPQKKRRLFRADQAVPEPV